MILAHDMGAMLRVAFAVYGVFWVVAIAGLFFGIGLLMKKRERLLEKQKHDNHH